MTCGKVKQVGRFVGARCRICAGGSLRIVEENLERSAGFLHGTEGGDQNVRQAAAENHAIQKLNCAVKILEWWREHRIRISSRRETFGDSRAHARRQMENSFSNLAANNLLGKTFTSDERKRIISREWSAASEQYESGGETELARGMDTLSSIVRYRGALVDYPERLARMRDNARRWYELHARIDEIMSAGDFDKECLEMNEDATRRVEEAEERVHQATPGAQAAWLSQHQTEAALEAIERDEIARVEAHFELVLYQHARRLARRKEIREEAEADISDLVRRMPPGQEYSRQFRDNIRELTSRFSDFSRTHEGCSCWICAGPVWVVWKGKRLFEDTVYDP